MVMDWHKRKVVSSVLRSSLTPSKISRKKKNIFDRGTNINPFIRKKKELEAKKKKEEEEAAKAYADFVESFRVSPSSKSSKWSSGGQYGTNGDKNKHNFSAYSSFSSSSSSSSSSSKSSRSTKRKKPEKKRKNIDIFLEEMKREQEAREAKQKAKEVREKLGFPPDPNDETNIPHPVSDISGGDPTTTNIYIRNLSPEAAEQDILELFGQYGDIASVKVMWPRTEEEHKRKSNRGFVSFMTRAQAEEAMIQLQNYLLMTHTIRLGWGKAVALPQFPLAYKIQFDEFGNAIMNQPPEEEDSPKHMVEIPVGAVKFEISFPKNRRVRKVIDRLALFVSKLGHVFEKLVMERELQNQTFEFLYNVNSSEHMYYRWKTYSLSQGDSIHTWRVEPFQMIMSGPFWIPPPENIKKKKKKKKGSNWDKVEDSKTTIEKQKKQEDLERDYPIGDGRKERENRERNRKRKKGSLRKKDTEFFFDILRDLSNDRIKIRNAMGFALDHAEESKDVVDILVDSLCIKNTPISKKIARLYLVSDILYNSSAQVRNASAYRSLFQNNLKKIFKGLNEAYVGVEGRITARAFKEKIELVLNVWQAWSLFQLSFTENLRAIFLRNTKTSKSRASLSKPRSSVSRPRSNAGKPKPSVNKPRSNVSKSKSIVSISKPIISKSESRVSKHRPSVSKSMPIMNKHKPSVVEVQTAHIDGKPMSILKHIINKSGTRVNKHMPHVNKPMPIMNKPKPSLVEVHTALIDGKPMTLLSGDYNDASGDDDDVDGDPMDTPLLEIFAKKEEENMDGMPIEIGHASEDHPFEDNLDGIPMK